MLNYLLNPNHTAFLNGRPSEWRNNNFKQHLNVNAESQSVGQCIPDSKPGHWKGEGCRQIEHFIVKSTDFSMTTGDDTRIVSEPLKHPAHSGTPTPPEKDTK